MLAPYPILYFHFQPGCPACAEAEPHLVAWQKKRRFLFPVVRLNVGLKDWKTGGYEAKATPGYALVVNDEAIATHEGPLTTEEVEAFVRDALAPAEAAEVEDDE